MATALDPCNNGFFSNIWDTAECVHAYVEHFDLVDVAHVSPFFAMHVDDYRKSFTSTTGEPPAKKMRLELDALNTIPPDDSPLDVKLHWAVMYELLVFFKACRAIGKANRPANLSFWEDSKLDTAYPILRRVYLSVFALAASQTSVERAFSIFTRLLSSLRNSMGADMAEAQGMLNWKYRGKGGVPMGDEWDNLVAELEQHEAEARDIVGGTHYHAG